MDRNAWRFVLELTSDAFLGSADTNEVVCADGLRTASFRGVLHQAVRMVHGGLSKEELAELEARWFGTVRNDGGFEQGQGLVLRQRRHAAGLQKEGSRYGLSGGGDSALAYMGYGLLHYSGHRERPALQAESWFEYTLAPPPGSARLAWTDDDARALTRALWLVGALLGCGSRSRRGFGSLQIAAWDGPQPPAPWPAQCGSPEALCSAWSAFLDTLHQDGSMATTLPAWTAISKQTRVFVWKSAFKSWQEALAAAGKKFRTFRQYYGAERPGRGPVGRDHDLMADLVHGHAISHAPKRAAFGLPHNYFFSGVRRKVNVQANRGLDRRASPLFFHITRLRDGRYVPVVAYVPARFLPQGTRISMRVSRGGASASPPPPDDEAIRHFLDGGPVEGYHDRNGTPIAAHWPGLVAFANEVGV